MLKNMMLLIIKNQKRHDSYTTIMTFLVFVPNLLFGTKNIKRHMLSINYVKRHVRQLISKREKNLFNLLHSKKQFPSELIVLE